MPQLLIFEGTYFSATDEEHFFAWLKSIPGVRRVGGTSKGLSVTFASAPSQPALRELLALHWRYRLPMKELARFRTSRNEAWFADPRAYWHNAVFGPQAVSPDIEARLHELHSAGQTPVQAIKALHAEYGLSLAEAKRRFSLSAAWAVERKANEPLQREAIRVLLRQRSGQLQA